MKTDFTITKHLFQFYLSYFIFASPLDNNNKAFDIDMFDIIVMSSQIT